MTTHATAKEAETARYEALRAIRRGGTGNPSGGKTRLVDWLEVCWADRVGKKKVRPSTLTREMSGWRSCVVPYLGDYKLIDLRPMTISNWVNTLLERGLSSSYVAQMLQMLGRLLDLAVRNDLIAVNNARLVEKPDVPKAEKVFARPEEMLAVEEVIDPWYAPIIPAFVDSGLRIGETAALDVRHFTVLVHGIGDKRVEVPSWNAYGQTILGGAFEVKHSTAFAKKELSGADSYMVVGDTQTLSGARGFNHHRIHCEPASADDPRPRPGRRQPAVHREARRTYGPA